jgi:pimeloyl-ACP methyl ester carboxylesterase
LNKSESNTELTTRTVKTSAAEWAVLTKKGGADVWICFAGYGQSAQSAMRFVEQIFPEATIVGVDLPAHGDTVMLEPHLYLDDITYLLGKIARNEDADRVNVFGYSMGGALALKCIELCPGKLKGALLVAPDGLKRYPMRWFSTSTSIGAFLFRRTMNDPKVLNRMMELLVSLKIMDRSVVDFFKFQIRDEEQRNRVYASWNAFKYLQPDLVGIRKVLFRYKIELRMVFGKRDKVIQSSLAEKLSGTYVKHAKVHYLDYGHGLMKNEVAKEVQQIISLEI